MFSFIKSMEILWIVQVFDYRLFNFDYNLFKCEQNLLIFIFLFSS